MELDGNRMLNEGARMMGDVYCSEAEASPVSAKVGMGEGMVDVNNNMYTVIGAEHYGNEQKMEFDRK